MAANKTMRHEFVIMTVLDAVRILEQQSDLSPKNPIITKTLTNLVKTLTDDYTPEEEHLILNDPRVLNMRQRLLDRLSHAEAEMERFWTECFLRHDNLSCADLEKFWYWENYDKLVDKEIEEIPIADTYQDYEAHRGSRLAWTHRRSAAPSKGAAFVGSGSLPLSAIIFHLKTGMPVTCVDSDHDACRKAAKLLKKLGLSEKIKTLHADGTEVDYQRYSTVFIASLIPNEQKNDIIARVRSVKNPCFIAVRSAERLHTLLYEPFNPDEGNAAKCRQISKTTHDTDVINTTYVMLHEQQRSLLPMRGTRMKVRAHKYGWGNVP